MKKNLKNFVGLILLLPSFFLASCNNGTKYNIRSAYEMVISNDMNAHKYFYFFEDRNIVTFNSNPGFVDDFYNEQSYVDLQFFMAMLDFKKQTYLDLFKNIDIKQYIIVKEKYTCVWDCYANKHVIAVFY